MHYEPTTGWLLTSGADKVVKVRQTRPDTLYLIQEDTFIQSIFLGAYMCMKESAFLYSLCVCVSQQLWDMTPVVS